MKRLSILKNLLWLIVPLLLIWAFRDISLSQVSLVLHRLLPIQVALLIGLNLVILFLFSSRWWLITRQQGHYLPYINLVFYRLAAFGISYYTPGPQFGGEPLQVHLLRRHHRVPTDTAVAGVTLDKLLELSVNFTILFAGLALVLLGSPLLDFGFSSLPLFAASIFILPLTYLIFIMLGFRPMARLLQKLDFLTDRYALLARLHSAALSTELQVSSISRSQPRLIIISFLLSLLTWALAILEYHLTLTFLGASLTLPQTITLLTAARIAFLTPLPGGIGALEAGQVLTISALGFDPALGISASLIIRARDLTLGAIGLIIAYIFTRIKADQPLSSPAGD